jgi:hypothetical protein
MSMSPEFKKIYSLNGSGGGSPQSNNNSYGSPNNRSNNQTLSPTMRAGAGRTIGTFGIGPEGGGGTSMIRSLSDAEVRNMERTLTSKPLRYSNYQPTLYHCSFGSNFTAARRDFRAQVLATSSS